MTPAQETTAKLNIPSQLEILRARGLVFDQNGREFTLRGEGGNWTFESLWDAYLFLAGAVTASDALTKRAVGSRNKVRYVWAALGFFVDLRENRREDAMRSFHVVTDENSMARAIHAAMNVQIEIRTHDHVTVQVFPKVAPNVSELKFLCAVFDHP